jgi:hypothetical protein
MRSVANDYSREPMPRRNSLDLEWLALNEGQAITRVTGDELDLQGLVYLIEFPFGIASGSNSTRHSSFERTLHRDVAGAPFAACRYNRYVIRLTLIAAAAIATVLLAGCKKNIQNQDAVRQGVMTYLQKRSDLLAMDVSVTSVAFRQDEATAQVHFQAKGNNSPGAGMNMQYVLERKDGQWMVRGRTGANASHGASGPGVNGASPAEGAAPGALDGMPRIPAPGGEGAAGLPPGHPGVAGSQALPPGHPSVSPDSTSQQK